MTATTRVRVLNANFRIEPLQVDIDAGRGWDVRAAKVDAVFDRLRGAGLMPSVITGQECSTNIRSDVWDMLGRERWSYWRNGNVIVWWDEGYHAKIEAGMESLPSPPPPPGVTLDPRRLAWVRLRLESTGDHLWYASSHFTVGDVDYQRQQMQAVVDALPNPRNTIFGADINSSLTSGDCPRTVAKAGRLFPLRSKLAGDRITNGTANSFNGWSPTVFGSEWIDDVMTGDNLFAYYGNMVLTDIEGATDHNFLLASIIQVGNES